MYFNFQGQRERPALLPHRDPQLLQRPVPARLPSLGSALLGRGLQGVRRGLVPGRVRRGRSQPGLGLGRGRRLLQGLLSGRGVRGHVGEGGVLRRQGGQGQHVPGRQFDSIA